jgi:hypothetical protein
MLSLSHFGRSVAAILALFAVVLLGILNAGPSGAQTLNRPRPEKLAVPAQATLQARAAERRRHHLRQEARLACASHERTLCLRVRARLARIDAQSSRVVRGGAHRRGPNGSGSASASDASDFSLSGSSGSGAPSSASGSSNGSGSSSGAGSSGGSGSASGPGSSPAGGPGATEPPLSGTLPEETSSTSSDPGFEPGLNSGANMSLDVEGSAQLGAKVVRIAFLIGETPAQLEPVIAGYAAKGIRVLPLACFDGTMPSAGEARQLASWAQAYGPGGTYWAAHPETSPEPIQAIELGNETSYGYQYGDEPGDRSYRERAETYAWRVEQTAEAITATGIPVGVLAQADDWSGDWVEGMYAAVPDLSRYVAGWTIHPYGPNWRERLEDLIAQTAAHGAPATIPIDITEWGLSTDNGDCVTENYGWSPCMTYPQAAEALSRTVSEMRQLLGARLHMFFVYAVRDQAPAEASNNREAYFGALQQDLQPKGAYTTAVQTLLASS